MNYMPVTNDVKLFQCESLVNRLPGVCIGSGMVDLELICDAGGHLRRGMYRKISPWFVPEILVNIAAGHISLKYGFKVIADMHLSVITKAGFFTSMSAFQ